MFMWQHLKRNMFIIISSSIIIINHIVKLFELFRDEDQEVSLGTIRWLGRLPDLAGQQLVAGILLVSYQLSFQYLHISSFCLYLLL